VNHVLFVAVKFGRMSKKQRERVEDEANFHKRRQNEMSTSNVCYVDADADRSPLSPSNNNMSEDVSHLVRSSSVIVSTTPSSLMLCHT